MSIDRSRDGRVIDAALALALAETGLVNIEREYPNHPGHLLTGHGDLRPPRELHPVFYGSYDWHSSVHQHWMLVRLLRRVPGLPAAGAVREALTAHLTAEAVAAEAAYLADERRRAFERPYGWAWLLALHAEAASWDDPDARLWARRLEPLAALLAGRGRAWLATRHPERSGTHANSAFAAALLVDAARATGDRDLGGAAGTAAERWYARDAGYPSWLEPSATDFLSPALVEADLMRRVSDPAAFRGWFERFLPAVGPLDEPVEVGDRSDPKLVHLDGLNLSRAWCWRGIAGALPPEHPRRELATRAAERHAEAGLRHVLEGDYAGTHWLPTFAVYLLTGGIAG